MVYQQAYRSFRNYVGSMRSRTAAGIGAGLGVGIHALRGRFNRQNRARHSSRRSNRGSLRTGLRYKVNRRGRGGVTRSLKKKEDLQGISQHHDLSMKKIKLTIGRQMKMKTIGRYVYNHSFQKVVIGGEGLQIAAAFAGHCGQAQLVGTISNARSTADFRWARSMYEMNPYGSTTGSSFLGPVISSAADSFFLQDINGKFSVTNLTNSAQDFVMYWFVCKSDTNDAPLAVWDNFINAESFAQAPLVAATTTTTATATAGFAPSSVVGERPGLHKGFKKLWKTLKKQEFVLQGGDTRDISYYLKYNKLIRKKWIQERPSAFLAGLTVVPFLICRGAPVGIFDTPQVVTAEMTYAATKFGVIQQYNVVCKAVPMNRMSVQSGFDGLVAGTHAEQLILDTDVIGTLVNV